MKTSGRRVNPQNLTAIAFSIWFNGLFILIVELYARFFGHRTNINTIILIIAALLSGGIVNVVYSRNDRYLKVYTKYVVEAKIENKGRAVILAWLFILFPYLLYFICWP